MEKNIVFLIFILYNWFVQKKLFKQIQIFRWICPFSNIVLVYEIVTFLTKKRSSLWITAKCFKTTEKHSLAVCGSLCGENQFLLIFIPFYRFVQNVFKQIQIFLRICPFSNMVRQLSFLSISVLVSEIVTFMFKKKSSLKFPQNASKPQKGIVQQYVAHFVEKTVLVNISPFYRFV